MTELTPILEMVSSYAPDADLQVIQKAYDLSARCHDGQMRKSGEPYLVHPLAVAGILAELRLDIDSIAVGLLHDVIEDTLVTYEEVKSHFGSEIADMVDGLSKIARFQFSSSEVAQAENFRKMLFAMARDIRVILVKLADRTHNMRTLHYMKADRQRSIARETLDIYAPIASRLGIQKLKVELEDLAFSYLHHDVFVQLQAQLNEAEERRSDYLEKVKNMIQEALRQQDLEGEVTGRVKHVYSIYKKMVRNRVEFDQIYDLTAFRILVDTVGQCYQALGITHAQYRPISERFKDYIAVPKSNGYQSLHTTVIGPQGEQLEIQIRTRQMHQVAESGIAAHWRYKEGRLALKREELNQVFKLRQLLESARDLPDPAEFMQSIRGDLCSDEVYVFTPRGEVKDFPEGATPLDFAFSVHTEVGLHCSGAKVNGRLVPFTYQLRNGDTIEILTSQSAHPSIDWEKLVVTSRARTKIRAYLRQEERERGRIVGREILERELKKYSINLNKFLKEGEIKRVLEKLHVRSTDELFVSIAFARIPLDKVIPEIVPADQLQKERRLAPPSPGQIVDRIRERFRPSRKSQSPVLIKGEGDILVNFARCCSPLNGDPIAGVITVGHGITVHTTGCSNLTSMDPERRIDVAWDENSKQPRSVRVRVICVDRPGLLAKMSDTISREEVNIQSAECRSIEDQKAVNMFELTVSDRKTLLDVMLALERIRGVISVERIPL